MRKRIRLIAVCLLLLILAAGCGERESEKKAGLLDPSNPVTVTVWHYYNGAQQQAFNELAAAFNATRGKELGIYVEGYSQGSVTDLEKAVSESAAGKVGAEPLPTMFSAYADTAYAVQQEGKLTDLTQYFTAEELSVYVESYLQEGYLGGGSGLYLFPVAKSTETMMMNVTDWEPFAAACGFTYDDLLTLEGVVRVAEAYYNWTDAQTPDVPDDGKAFYGRDSMSNYFIINLMQMGTEIFAAKDGQVTLHTDKAQIRRLWDCWYAPYMQGWFAHLGKFRSDDVKTGDLLAYTGSTSSSMYFPSVVMTEESSRPIDYVILPVPVMEGGTNVNVQQGAGMAVTASDAAHEYAACEFLRWFTESKNNIRFVCESAYLPVTKAANTVQALDEVIQENQLSVNPKIYDCLTGVLSQFDSMTFYTPACFENGYATRKILDYNLADKAAADKAELESRVAAGEDRQSLLAEYLSDAAFDAWYDSFCRALQTASGK